MVIGWELITSYYVDGQFFLKGANPMKIGIISDIHIDKSYKETDLVEDRLIEVVNDKALNILIIAGDISNDYELSLMTLDRIEIETECTCLFVPGNHDLWNKHHPDIIHTQWIYEKIYAHKSCLCDKPYELGNDYVIIGDTGWYDFSFGNNQYAYEDYLVGYYKERQWQDKKYINWNVSDVEKCKEIYGRLTKQIDRYKDKKIILVTHMILHPYFLVPLPNETWNYFNAFLGTANYKPLLKSPVQYVIMGHVHYRKNLEENNIKYLCRCLNYRKQWSEDNAKKQIEETLAVLEIETN